MVRGSRSCDVVVIGGGLSGLRAARDLAARGVDVLVLEAQERVGGRTLTVSHTDGGFIDHGGQYVSPGQDRLVALADEIGVKLFPSWSGGRTVRWSGGARSTFDGLLPPDDPEAEPAAREAAATLTRMAESVPLDAPWAAPDAAAWDADTLHGWLADNIASLDARTALSQAIEGVFAGGAGRTSLLAALFWIRSGDPLVPFVSTADPGPERRFDGGAQQLSSRMAAGLGDRVVLGATVSRIDHRASDVNVTAGDLAVSARRAIIAVPPALAGRIRYVPALPAVRDQLTQRTPMRWLIKVHCVYPSRFWAYDGLSGLAKGDAGLVRLCADNSPPSGSPGILVGFIGEGEAPRAATMTAGQLRTEVLADLVRYFGDLAGQPLGYHEMVWGDDEFTRGAEGGYWTPGVWTTYGPALQASVGVLHWAGTETSPVWNGKMEGAVRSGERAAVEVLTAMS